MKWLGKNGRIVQFYLVGGAVRDLVMGNEPNDYDYVVVNGNPELMLANGFTQVGKDFPVFLHPETKEEYALARTERSTGDGHKGFTCDWEGVTLHEDLSRRDLTINAMAIFVGFEPKKGHKLSGWGLEDPYNGRKDIENKVLRATSDAFLEDPLRVFRCARFLARFGPSWHIDETTMGYFDYVQSLFAYALDMNGGLPGPNVVLPPERIWNETAKALSSKHPSLYFEALKGFGGGFGMIRSMENTDQRRDHHPEGDVWTHTKLVMDYASDNFFSAEEIFACFAHDFGKPEAWNLHGTAHGHEKSGLPYINKFCDDYKVPNKFRELALLVCEFHTKIHGCLGRGDNRSMKPKTIMRLFEDTGAMKHPERFRSILRCCMADARGRGSNEEQIAEFRRTRYLQLIYLRQCLGAVLETDTKSISEAMLDAGRSGINIGAEVRAAKISSIREVQNKWKQI